jgi:hypothetical protein
LKYTEEKIMLWHFRAIISTSSGCSVFYKKGNPEEINKKYQRNYAMVVVLSR